MVARGENFGGLVRSLLFSVDSNDINITKLILLSRVAIMTRDMLRAPRQDRGNATVAVRSELNPEGEGKRQTHTNKFILRRDISRERARSRVLQNKIQRCPVLCYRDDSPV